MIDILAGVALALLVWSPWIFEAFTISNTRKENKYLACWLRQQNRSDAPIMACSGSGYFASYKDCLGCPYCYYNRKDEK